jgi:hypothetical protein
VNFSTAYDFSNKADGARWCIPDGFAYRLFSEQNQTGFTFDLVGTGRYRFNWDLALAGDDATWESGCFLDLNTGLCVP